MPNRSEFRLDERPDHQFHVFDELLSALDDIPDGDLREQVSDQLADRALDTDWLLDQIPLSSDTVEQLEQIQRWGCGDLSVQQPLGSILVATISGASSVGMVDYVAYIFARREQDRIAYSVIDEAGAEVELGDYAEPLTLAGMIDLVERLLAQNAPWPTNSPDVLSGYFMQDRAFDLRVHSTVYPQLERWYSEAAAEWLAAHS